MKLSAAISGVTPGWEILLSQLGLPFYTAGDTQLASNNCSVLILTSDIKVPKNIIYNYISSGGCIITEADIAGKYLGIKTASRNISYILVQDNELFNVEGICDISKSCLIPAQANHLADQEGLNTVLIAQMGKGCIVVLPSGFINLVTDEKIARKNFYSPYAKKETNERVALVSKGMITHIINSALEYLYHFRNLPYITLWQYPDGAESIFSFRIDTDFGSRQDINELYSLLDKHNVKGTWFLETKSAEPYLTDYKNFRNQEIALHCYRHRVFKSYDKNKEQIEKGIELLNTNSLSPVGFAAPYGQWNINLGRVINDLKFQYSSEFGYAYDALPFYPVLNGSFSSALQIPVHPVSLGRLHWGGHTSSEMLSYFERLFKSKISSYEPINIYAHPSELKFNILNDILTSAASLNIPCITYGEIAEWWKKRVSLKWEAHFEEGSIRIQAINNEVSYWVKVRMPDKKIILSPIGEEFNKKIKTLDNSAVKLDSHLSVKELRKKSLRMHYHDYLSFYRKLKQ